MTAVTVTQLNNAATDCDHIAAIATSASLTAADRLGNVKKTLQGALAAIGYQPPVAYAGSLSMTSGTQTVEYDGALYAPLISQLPFTTSGTFETSKFRVIQLTNEALITATDTTTARSLADRFADIVNVKNCYGPNNDYDDATALRAAVAIVAVAGGLVFVSAKSTEYSLTAAVGDTTNTAVTIPSKVKIVGASQGGVTVKPGANNVICFRFEGLNGALESIQITNPDSRTNVSGIRLTPADEAQTTERTDIEFNSVTDVSIRSVAEAIVLRCGPTVGGSDSYCYYNRFTNIDIRNCTLGIWLKVPNTAAGSGCNRNQFINVRVGESGTNTGLKIDAGDTNTFVGCSFEGIQSGTSPNATPTAIQIAYNSASYGCTRNKFYGVTIESCTRDWDNDNDLTEVYGGYWTGSYYSPSGRALAVNMTADKAEALVITATDALGSGKTPATRVDVALKANGEGINFEDDGSHANQYFSFDGSKGGGAYSYVEFLYNGTAEILTWGGASSAYAGNMRLSNPTNGYLAFGQNNTDRHAIDTSGNFYPVTDNAYSLGKSGQRFTEVWATNGTIQTSDETLKNILGESDLGLDFVLATPTIRYRWKTEKNKVDADGSGSVSVKPLAGKKINYGFSAQCVKTNLGGIDAAMHVEGDDGIQALRTDQLIAVLWRAVQELAEKIN